MAAAQGTLYYQQVIKSTNPADSTNLCQYTGPGVSTNARIIAVGNNGTGLYTAAPGIPVAVFLTSPTEAPTTPTGTPFSVVVATANVQNTLYEANSDGTYQVVGNIISINLIKA